jgi:hypothetical protein
VPERGMMPRRTRVGCPPTIDCHWGKRACQIGFRLATALRLAVAPEGHVSGNKRPCGTAAKRGG